MKTSTIARTDVLPGSDGASRSPLAAPGGAAAAPLARRRTLRAWMAADGRDDNVTLSWLLVLGAALLVGGGYALSSDFSASLAEAGWQVLLAHVAVVAVGLPLVVYAIGHMLGRIRTHLRVRGR